MDIKTISKQRLIDVDHLIFTFFIPLIYGNIALELSVEYFYVYPLDLPNRLKHFSSNIGNMLVLLMAYTEYWQHARLSHRGKANMLVAKGFPVIIGNMLVA